MLVGGCGAGGGDDDGGGCWWMVVVVVSSTTWQLFSMEVGCVNCSVEDRREQMSILYARNIDKKIKTEVIQPQQLEIWISFRQTSTGALIKVIKNRP